MHGRRSTLAAIAFVYGVIGWSYLTLLTPSRAQGFSWLPEWISEHWMGGFWLAAAILAAIALLVPKFRPWAIGAALFPPTTWALIFTISWVIGAAPTGIVTTESESA